MNWRRISLVVFRLTIGIFAGLGMAHEWESYRFRQDIAPCIKGEQRICEFGDGYFLIRKPDGTFSYSWLPENKDAEQ